jgi:hypothetical protein
MILKWGNKPYHTEKAAELRAQRNFASSLIKA